MSARSGLTILMAVAGLLLPPFAIGAQQMNWRDLGFAADDLFTPVWVSGELRAELSKQQVGLSDGESEFGVGYTLDASSVELYQ